MAGRSLSAARAAAEAERIRQASATPTPQRTQPIHYTPDLDAEALALADIGMTEVETAAHWAIDEETLEEWRKAHPSFAAALRRARTRAKAWWQRQPRLALREKDNKFPAGAWAQQVRALFPEYADHKGVTVTLNLADLVRVERRQPTVDRLPGTDKPLIEGEASGLEHGRGREGSARINLLRGPDDGDA